MKPNSIIILAVLLLIVIGAIVYMVMSAKAKEKAAHDAMLLQIIQYKQSQGEQRTKQKTAWLDAITGIGTAVGGIFGGPAGAAGAGAAGEGASNLPFFS